ncbi:MAG: DUF3486 family protein [Nitrosomonadales bacterium]|nr:DUF3486 family protein [Nitrosomonadales bacterium]
MTQRNSCSTLPKDIRFQLHQRIVDSEFGDYSAHSDWLESLGYSISRSSIHRYVMDNEEEIRRSVSERSALSEDEKFIIDIRMRCLEVSSGFAEGDFDLLFKKGEVVLNWVKSS